MQFKTKTQTIEAVKIDYSDPALIENVVKVIAGFYQDRTPKRTILGLSMAKEGFSISVGYEANTLKVALQGDYIFADKTTNRIGVISESELLASYEPFPSMVK